MITRMIPSSGEALPVIGLGTWIQFDVGPADGERAALKEVLQGMASHGATVIDSSPMYGRAEGVVGDLTRETGLADRFFYATKVWTSGEESGKSQIEDSFRLLQRRTIDLLQIHNMLDWKTHLATLLRLKEEGRIRYTGVTHYQRQAHDSLEDLIRKEPFDFVQFNYSILERHAERSLLPTAQDRGIAVLINEPFEKGALFKAVQGKALPAWAGEWGITSWSGFFLKYLLAHPAVTCVIPGTSNPVNLRANLEAGSGPLPDDATRKQMIALIENL